MADARTTGHRTIFSRRPRAPTFDGWTCVVGIGLLASGAWALAHRTLYETDTTCSLGALTRMLGTWPGILLIAGPAAILVAASTMLRDRPIKLLASAALIDELILIVLLMFTPAYSGC